jgi:hypothetical protein
LSHKKQPTEEYHVFDSILVEEKIVTPQSSSLVWRVARIFKMDTTSLEIQLFERYSDWAKAKEAGYISEVRTNFSPQRRLIKQMRLLLSKVHRQIAIADILGRAHVAHDPLPLGRFYATSIPSFYCHDRLGESGAVTPLAKPLTTCVTCETSSAKLEKEYRQFMRDVKLPAIDYYSGGGGGMIGAKGFFKHEHAVEMDSVACETLRLVSH